MQTGLPLFLQFTRMMLDLPVLSNLTITADPKALIKPFHIILLVGCILSSACTSIDYYSQAVSGQIEIIMKQRPITDVIGDENTEPSVRQKLAEINDILDFAHNELGLPDNGSYRKYIDLGRRHVVWNVFATPELSLQPKQWCYIIVGCMGYRGYFSENRADRYARSLQADGWEVYVGGVSAYSTLGWFRDPVMNTMLYRESWELARLLFHELAHQRLYIQDDTDFNEAFADAVALIGLQKWLDIRPPALKQIVDTQLGYEQEFIKLVLTARDKLERIYTSALPAEAKQTEKRRIMGDLKSAYLTLKHSRGEDGRYDNWIDGANNARLSAVSTYRTLVPDFLKVYRQTGSSLEKFYTRVESVKDCRRSRRMQELRKYREISACPP